MKPKIIPIAKYYKTSEANGWVYHRGGVSPTLCVGQHSGVQPKTIVKMAKIYRIRKLTPRECFRLMGVSDEDISKIQNYPLITEDGKTFNAPKWMDLKTVKQLSISESQQYKLAGNSIVVQVLEGIFTQLFRSDTDSLF